MIAAAQQVKTATNAMDRNAAPPLEESIAAALDWWRSAGVDHCYTEDTVPWLTDPVKEEAAAAAVQHAEPEAEAPPPPAIGGNSAGWPADLATFRKWWLSEPTLDPVGRRRRIAPIGTTGAELMVLIPMPEAEDTETLLSGVQGRLVERMLAAMGIAADSAYLASALPTHTTVPDWSALAETGLGDVLRHHCALVHPKRLLVLGRRIPPLIAHDPAQAPPAGGEISFDSWELPALVSYAPEVLLEQPRARAGLWRRWLEWTKDGLS